MIWPLPALFGGMGGGLGGLHQVGHHGADGDGEAFLGVAWRLPEIFQVASLNSNRLEWWIVKERLG